MTWDASVSERFSREVPLERARLALEDPTGEADAVAPLTQVQARQLLLEGGAQIPESVDLATISTDAPPPMLIDRMDPEGHTILYGTGGVGKGALACWWIVQLVREGHGVLIVDYEAHPAEWSRRIAALAPSAHQSGLIRHIAPHAPLKVAADQVGAEALSFGLEVVVVDSAVMACGSDPLKPEVAGEYAAAVMRVGLPVLSLAHVTKADDMRYPFGSVFWHNLARTTWGLQADQSGAVVLSHRKHNNYASLGRFAVTTTWDDGKLREVWEKGYGIALRERLTDVLTATSMTVSEIVETLNGDEWEGTPVKRTSVTQALRRGVADSVFTVAADRWSLS